VVANAATVGTLTSAAKIVAAVKIAVTARFFGAGDELDAYLTAFIIPSLFGDSVAGALTPSLVPGLIRAMSGQSEDAARRLARSSLALALASMIAMALVLAAVSPWVLPILGSSFSPAKLRLTGVLFLGLLCWLPLGAAIASWRAILNAHGRFALAAIGPLCAPLISIAFLYLGAARWGVEVLVLGVFGGLVLECGLLIVAVRRLGFPVLPAWRVRWTPELTGVSRQAMAMVASALAMSASALVDQVFAGTLGSGAVSAFGFGTKLVAVLGMVVGTGVATASLPEFAHLAARREWRSLNRIAMIYGGVATAAILPCTVLLMWFSEPLARIFFERGAFGPSDTLLVAQVQRFALIEAPFAVLFSVGSRLAVAVGANRLLAQIGAIVLVVNVLADWVFSRWWGVAGLAASTGLVRGVAVVLLVAMLYRREPRLFKRAMAVSGHAL
jgi:putative peptidoglycan lipid II flippase